MLIRTAASVWVAKNKKLSFIKWHLMWKLSKRHYSTYSPKKAHLLLKQRTAKKMQSAPDTCCSGVGLYIGLEVGALLKAFINPVKPIPRKLAFAGFIFFCGMMWIMKRALWAGGIIISCYREKSKWKFCPIHSGKVLTPGFYPLSLDLDACADLL